MNNSGDARNKLPIINRLLYSICAAKELTCLLTYFLSAVDSLTKCEICIVCWLERYPIAV